MRGAGGGGEMLVEGTAQRATTDEMMVEEVRSRNDGMRGLEEKGEEPDSTLDREGIEESADLTADPTVAKGGSEGTGVDGWEQEGVRTAETDLNWDLLLLHHLRDPPQDSRSCCSLLRSFEPVLKTRPQSVSTYQKRA